MILPRPLTFSVELAHGLTVVADVPVVETGSTRVGGQVGVLKSGHRARPEHQDEQTEYSKHLHRRTAAASFRRT